MRWFTWCCFRTICGFKITADSDWSHKIGLLFGRKSITNLDGILKSKDITLPAKVCIVKAMVFPVVMYRCESWTMMSERQRNDVFKLWCWRSSWESLGQQGDQSVNPKGNPPWIFIGRTVAEVEAPIPWSPDAKSLLIGKDPDAGKDWRQTEKEAAEGEMVG